MTMQQVQEEDFEESAIIAPVDTSAVVDNSVLEPLVVDTTVVLD